MKRDERYYLKQIYKHILFKSNHVWGAIFWLLLFIWFGWVSIPTTIAAAVALLAKATGIMWIINVFVGILGSIAIEKDFKE